MAVKKKVRLGRAGRARVASINLKEFMRDHDATPGERDAELLRQLGSSGTDYPKDPSEANIECFPNPNPGALRRVTFTCTEMTSLCPKTAQPDFGRVVITYVPDRLCIESKSLKMYLFAHRSTGAFWERLASDICDRLFATARPKEITVEATMNVRGGIAITAVASRARRGGRR